MLLNANIETYGLSDEFLENMDWELFRSYWPLAGEKRPKMSWDIASGPCRLTSEEATGLAQMGIRVTLVPMPHVMHVKMADQERRWSHGEDVQPQDLMSGAAVQITIPDLALLNMNEVTWLEDCCTVELQRSLDEG